MKNVCCHEHHGKASAHCCCDSGTGFQRRFFSKEEEIARLEEYLKDLQAEVKALEAYVQALKEE